MLRIKRTYDPPASGDDRRILVERLWPRGIRKEALTADAWMKNVAPSSQLRKWFSHRVERWEQFRRKYEGELSAHPEAWEPILEAAEHGPVTLLYSARDPLHNGAVVLRDYLAARSTKRPTVTERSRGSRELLSMSAVSRSRRTAGRVRPPGPRR